MKCFYQIKNCALGLETIRLWWKFKQGSLKYLKQPQITVVTNPKTLASEIWKRQQQPKYKKLPT